MNPHRRTWPALTVALIMVLLACSEQPRGRVELLVFAATSLTDALEEIGLAFEEEGQVQVFFNYGGSQHLAQQIASGAPADLFIAAGEPPMAFLAKEGFIEGEPVNILSNKLVVVARSGGVQLDSLAQLQSPAVQRVAIAAPDLAPAGWYARSSLKRLGLWDGLQGKLVMGADVRVTLAYVEAGNVDVGLVYQTDAMIATGLEVLDIVPPDSYPPVVYPAAVVQGADESSEARRFLGFLQSDRAIAIFRKHGFQAAGQ